MGIFVQLCFFGSGLLLTLQLQLGWPDVSKNRATKTTIVTLGSDMDMVVFTNSIYTGFYQGQETHVILDF